MEELRMEEYKITVTGCKPETEERIQGLYNKVINNFEKDGLTIDTQRIQANAMPLEEFMEKTEEDDREGLGILETGMTAMYQDQKRKSGLVTLGRCAPIYENGNLAYSIEIGVGSLESPEDESKLVWVIGHELGHLWFNQNTRSGKLQAKYDRKIVTNEHEQSTISKKLADLEKKLSRVDRHYKMRVPALVRTKEAVDDLVVQESNYFGRALELTGEQTCQVKLAEIWSQPNPKPLLMRNNNYNPDFLDVYETQEVKDRLKKIDEEIIAKWEKREREGPIKYAEAVEKAKKAKDASGLYAQANIKIMRLKHLGEKNVKLREKRKKAVGTTKVLEEGWAELLGQRYHQRYCQDHGINPIEPTLPNSLELKRVMSPYIRGLAIFNYFLKEDGLENAKKKATIIKDDKELESFILKPKTTTVLNYLTRLLEE